MIVSDELGQTRLGLTKIQSCAESSSASRSQVWQRSSNHLCPRLGCQEGAHRSQRGDRNFLCLHGPESHAALHRREHPQEAGALGGRAAEGRCQQAPASLSAVRASVAVLAQPDARLPSRAAGSSAGSPQPLLASPAPSTSLCTGPWACVPSTPWGPPFSQAVELRDVSWAGRASRDRGLPLVLLQSCVSQG